MDAQPLISVTIIFFDAERFIQEAIDSVFAQTYAHWELILVDDGSSDRSTDIARAYARRYPGKVHYLEHQGHRNLGTGPSRNLGLRHSRGEYVAMLDADDVWFPQTLAEQVAIFDAHPEAGMVYGPWQWWNSWNPEGKSPDYSVQRMNPAPETLVMPPTLLTMFLQNRAPVPLGALMRRELLERLGGYEEAFLDLYEDQTLYAKICLEAPVYVARGYWYRYRQYPESITQVGARNGHDRLTRQDFLLWLESYLTRKGVDDRELWSALRREFWPYRHPRLGALAEHGRRCFAFAGRSVRSAIRRALPLTMYRWLQASRHRHSAVGGSPYRW